MKITSSETHLAVMIKSITYINIVGHHITFLYYDSSLSETISCLYIVNIVLWAELIISKIDNVLSKIILKGYQSGIMVIRSCYMALRYGQ